MVRSGKPLPRLNAAVLCLGLAAGVPALSQAQSPQKPANPSATKSAHRHPAKKKQVAPEPPPAPPAPEPPPTLAKLPPGRPRVTYRDGQLSIASDNSTLSDILKAVRAQTGAAIEVPFGAAGAERVVTRLGPGPADEVLGKLLAGSAFDYVILGADGRPGAIQTVVLRPKQPVNAAGDGGPAMGVPPTQAAGQPPGYAADSGEMGQPDMPPDEGDTGDDAAGPVQPQAQPPQQQAAPPQSAEPAKTPEQLLQELQRMQQQRQQQMEQQGQPNPPQ